MRKNKDQNNSEYRHFSRSGGCPRQPVKIFIGAFNNDDDHHHDEFHDISQVAETSGSPTY